MPSRTPVMRGYTKRVGNTERHTGRSLQWIPVIIKRGVYAKKRSMETATEAGPVYGV